MDKKINVISDLEGNEIIIINDIRFKGKRRIDWENVEQYLKEYIGNCYEVVETSDHIFIGSDFPSELKGSDDTRRLYLSLIYIFEKFHQPYREGKIRLWDHMVRTSALYGRKQIRYRHGEIKWGLGSENRISAELKLLTDPGCITDDAPVGENCAFWHP